MESKLTQTTDPPLPDTDVLVSALIVGQDREAGALVERWIDGGLAYDAICARGIQPAMYQVGELWSQGRISVAQEHLATAIAQRLLVVTYQAARFAPAHGRRALFACVEGNHHGLGLRMVADAFAIAGWDVEYLGTDVPTRDLVEQVDAWRPELVGLSAGLTEHIAVADAVAARIRDRLADAAPRIMLGGRPVTAGAALPTPLDVDVWTADLGSAAASL